MLFIVFGRVFGGFGGGLGRGRGLFRVFVRSFVILGVRREVVYLFVFGVGLCGLFGLWVGVV